MDGASTAAQESTTMVERMSTNDDPSPRGQQQPQHPTASSPSSAQLGAQTGESHLTAVICITSGQAPPRLSTSSAWEGPRPRESRTLNAWASESPTTPSIGQVEEPVLAFDGEDAPEAAASQPQPPASPQPHTPATAVALLSPQEASACKCSPESSPRATSSWDGGSALSSNPAGSTDATKLTPRSDSTFSTQSAVSTFGKNLRKASERCLTALVGDDEQVRDKWDNYDDDVEEEVDAVKRGLSMTTARAKKRNMRAMARAKGNQVCPSSSGASASEMTAGESDKGKDGCLSTDSRSIAGDELGERRSSKMLIWHYCQTLMFSMLVTAVCIPIVAFMSMIKWHVEVDDPDPDPSSNSSALHPLDTQDGPQMSRVRPNAVALQWMLLLQLIFPLVIYSVLLYACIRRSFLLPWPMVGLVVFTLAWAVGVCGLFYALKVDYWFYYIDLFLIVAAYVPCMCMVGWYVDEDENASIRQRLGDVLVTGLLETIVAAATLVYCYFLMPLFFTLISAWLQMLWLCVVHPLYFELTTGFIVRKVLHRNRKLGRNHILYLLSIVHSMVHVVVLGTSLQASVEPVRILALTMLLYNMSKLTWRSTIIQRDLFVERLFQGWSFNYTLEDRANLSRMVSVSIITEIILENASIFIAPFMMYRMYKEPIFMAVVPNSFFDNGGTYPVKTLITLIAMLLGFTSVFDLIFYFLNYNVVQHLPLINTWRRIKRSQGWYLVFLVYAFACMGVLFLFLTMMILPRAAYCHSNNYCDCTTLAYRTICQGEYISMLVDYLV